MPPVLSKSTSNQTKTNNNKMHTRIEKKNTHNKYHFSSKIKVALIFVHLIPRTELFDANKCIIKFCVFAQNNEPYMKRMC